MDSGKFDTAARETPETFLFSTAILPAPSADFFSLLRIFTAVCLPQNHTVASQTEVEKYARVHALDTRLHETGEKLSEGN